MSIMLGLDPRDLSQSGWGVIFSPTIDPAIPEALTPLLELRRQQAGDLYRQLEYLPQEGKNAFLQRYGMGPGPADPQRLPYYLLIVGDPLEIPYQFQINLGVNYAVGRLWFNSPTEFSTYAEGVVSAEQAGLSHSPRAVFFAPANPDDLHSQLVSSYLVQPLAEALIESQSTWKIDRLLADEAYKIHLLDALQAAPPRLLFTGGHSLTYPIDHPMFATRQGGLVCQDWPGPNTWQGGLPEAFCLLGDDLPADLNLKGMIAVFYSSFSLGTMSAAEKKRTSPLAAEQYPSESVISYLPQRLLGTHGALGMIGLIDRQWTYSFSKEYSTELVILSTLLRQLQNGDPLGKVFDNVSARYAELASDLVSLVDEIEFGAPVDQEQLMALYTSHSDMRSLAIFGDPAVRISIGEYSPPTKEVDLSKLVSQPDVPPGETRVPLELEISLTPLGADMTFVELSYLDPSSDNILPPMNGKTRIDFPMVVNLPTGYGMQLFKMLFLEPDLSSLFLETLSIAEASNRNLDIRVKIEPDAERLHDIYWETITDGEQFHITNENISFSRFLSSPNWRRIELLPQGELRALLVTSSPADLEKYDLAPIDIAADVAFAEAALGELPTTRLTTRGEGDGVTLNNLRATMQEQYYDILYLKCHTAFVRESPFLWLEDDEGQVRIVSIDEFMQVFNAPMPRLVVLTGEQTRANAISIQQARASNAIAIRFAQAGVPAVLSIPTDTTNQTADQFLPVFFQELRMHGRVNQAVSAARRTVRDRTDWWRPVLYQRLQTGKIWLDPTEEGSYGN